MTGVEGEPKLGEQIGFQVPSLIYANLKVEGLLGNFRTKVFIRATSDLNDYPFMCVDDLEELTEDQILVYMRLRQFPSSGPRVEDDYYFIIDSQGDVVVLKSWQLGGNINAQVHEPPSRELFIRELRAAQKLQPTLKT